VDEVAIEMQVGMARTMRHVSVGMQVGTQWVVVGQSTSLFIVLA
jgi:hypothetical protein